MDGAKSLCRLDPVNRREPAGVGGRGGVVVQPGTLIHVPGVGMGWNSPGLNMRRKWDGVSWSQSECTGWGAALPDLGVQRQTSPDLTAQAVAWVKRDPVR